MPSRNFKNRAEYVGVIVEVAEKELASAGASQLYYATNHNISGGHELWGSAANAVYRHPETLEEGLLALELRRVLEIAIGNQLRSLLDQVKTGDFSMSLFGLPMDFGVFMGTLEKLAVRNPPAAAYYKVQAEQLSQRANKESLTQFLTNHVLSHDVTGEDWCERL